MLLGQRVIKILHRLQWDTMGKLKVGNGGNADLQVGISRVGRNGWGVNGEASRSPSIGLDRFRAIREGMGRFSCMAIFSTINLEVDNSPIGLSLYRRNVRRPAHNIYSHKIRQWRRQRESPVEPANFASTATYPPIGPQPNSSADHSRVSQWVWDWIERIGFISDARRGVWD